VRQKGLIEKMAFTSWEAGTKIRVFPSKLALACAVQLFRIIGYTRNDTLATRFAMRSTSTLQPRIKLEPVLHGACEKSARSVITAIRRTAAGRASAAALSDLVDTLTGVIEQTTELLLAGKHVRVIEDNEAMTTQAAADLLNVSRPHLVKLLETGKIPQLPKVGRHRRVARVAVLKYQRAEDAKRTSALKALSSLSQRHRLGY
jgi:excisionase family DNA binding protein